MANDLSDLDPTLPLATDPVSEGDDKIRETRLKVINWAGVEHTLTGEHKYIFGAPGTRPAAGFPGRIFIDTTNGRVERDTGSAWVMLNCVQQYRAYTVGTALVGAAPGVVQSVTVDIASGGRLFVDFQGDLSGNAAGSFITLNLRVNAVVQPEFSTYTVVSTAALNTVGLHAVMLTPPTGSILVEILAVVNSGAGGVGNRNLSVQVL